MDTAKTELDKAPNDTNKQNAYNTKKTAHDKLVDQEAKDRIYEKEAAYDTAYDTWKTAHDEYEKAKTDIEGYKTSIPAAKAAINKAKWDRSQAATEAQYEAAIAAIASAQKSVTDLTTLETAAKEIFARQADDVGTFKTALTSKKSDYDNEVTKWKTAAPNVKPTAFDPATAGVPVPPAEPA